MKRIQVGVLIGLAVVGVAVFGVTRRNDTFLSEVIQAASEPDTAVSLCPLKCSSISSPCVRLDQGERVIALLRAATTANPPGHGQRNSEQVLKITSNGAKNRCFVLVEYKGWEEQLYLWKIDTERGCSETPFKYSGGTVRVANFLRASNGARGPNPAQPTGTPSACLPSQAAPARRG